MHELDDRLDRWVAAGLLDDEQAAAIRAFEDELPAVQEAVGQPLARGRRIAAAEAIGYVGAALAVAAIGLLFADLWERLTTGGQLTLVGLLTVLLAGAGVALQGHDRAPLERLGSVLFTGATIGVGWLAVLVGDRLLGLTEVRLMVTVGAAVTVVSVPLYLWRRRLLPQATALASLVLLTMSLMALPALPPRPVWFGLVLWAIGVGWALAGLGGWLPPAWVSGLLGSGVALVGVQVASFDEARVWLLALGVLTAAGLVVLAVAAETLHHLGVGAVGLFVLVPQLTFELFGDAIGAPATLLVVGLLLVLTAVGLGRARREVGGAPRGGGAPA